MSYNLINCSSDIKQYIFNLQKEVDEIINEDLIGLYVHGSLAMGGFNPHRSDIDVLVVTEKTMTVEIKRKLAKLFLKCSTSPFPVEISFLNMNQLTEWRHPCLYDFHYSEFWRERYESDLVSGTYKYLNGDVNTDADLAAHIMITTTRGVCVKGRPIGEVFPLVPRSDYLSSILGDFKDCLTNIEEDPIYCTLNLIRVFWYVKEGVISSKLEAGNWGLLTFPKEMSMTINKVMGCYLSEKVTCDFEKDELVLIKNYLSEKVQALLH